jgi:hypothetical protein
MERVTPANPFDREPSPFKNSELIEYLDGIFRTGGMKPTGGGEQKSQRVLIYPYKKNQEVINCPLHLDICFHQASINAFISNVELLHHSNPLLQEAVSQCSGAIPRQERCSSHTIYVVG